MPTVQCGLYVTLCIGMNKRTDEAEKDFKNYKLLRTFIKLYIAEDWTGPINYYRNLPFSRVSEEREQVDVPCLLLTGNKDQFVNLESVVKSTDYVKKFSLKIVDGASHFPHQELPDTVNKLLLSFLVSEYYVLLQ